MAKSGGITAQRADLIQLMCLYYEQELSLLSTLGSTQIGRL